ncbi:MAG: PQQ-binding-like beta-propeller repeat protein [Chloroflexia bacterium]
MPRSARRLAAFLVCILPILGLSGAAVGGGPALHAAGGVPGPGDWPMYMHSPDRQSWNADETALSPATAPHVRLKWQALIGAALVPSPAVVGDTIFEGSWDGNEYAVSTADGSVRWKVFLGTTGDYPRQCMPPGAGITSGAAVGNGLVYVGGGGDSFYALDPATGQPAWKLYTGDNSHNGGAYNWASPLVYGDRVYSGMASFCDRPFIRGYVWGADAATGKNERIAYTVPETMLGGGVWSSPALDITHNRLFATTGSPGAGEGHLDSIIAVELNGYSISDAWKVPRSNEGADPDWSTTPNVFTLPNGKTYVAAGNKNGVFYVFDADHLIAGPVWSYKAANSGECPQCGEGILGSSAYHDGVLYVAGGNTIVRGKAVGGSVRAFDAATGALHWEYPTGGPILASLAGANGVIIAAGDDEIHLIDAVRGNNLLLFKTNTTVWGAPVVSHGVIYVADRSGTLYAYEVPPELVPPPATPAPSAPTAAPTMTPAPVPTALAPVHAPSSKDVLFFPATGHTLAPPLRDYWQRYGGLAQFGYPLTEPFTETVGEAEGGGTRDYLVQYFERARFEYHPENAGTAYAVLLGLLGLRFHQADPPAQPVAGLTFLNGHNLGGAFRSYWQAHGGLFVNGYPISEERDELSPTDGKTYRVQYFERVRMELHPEYAGTPNQVLLGLLGTQLLSQRGWIR